MAGGRSQGSRPWDTAVPWGALVPSSFPLLACCTWISSRAGWRQVPLELGSCGFGCAPVMLPALCSVSSTLLSPQKHPDFPKKPLTPYFRFFMEKRAKYAKLHPEMSNLDLTKILSKKYKELPEKKKVWGGSQQAPSHHVPLCAGLCPALPVKPAEPKLCLARA